MDGKRKKGGSIKMRYKKMLFIFFMLVLSFCLTGCWDKRNMEDRSYVITMGVDKYQGDERQRYSVSLGSAKISELSDEPKQEGDISSIQVQGNTLAEAIHKADCFHSRKMYLGQLKTVIFGQDLLEDKELFLSALDELERNPDISEKVILLSCKGNAIDGIELILKQDTSTGLFIWDFFKNSVQDIAVTEKLDLETFLMELRNSNGQGVIPQIHFADNRIRFGGGTALADYTFCGYLSDEEERGLQFLKEQGKGAVYSGYWDNTVIPLSVIKNKCKYTFEEKEGKLLCTIDVKVKGSIDGKGFFAQDTLDEDTIEQLENLFGQIIKTEIENTITLAQQEYQKDILDISSKLYQKDPNLYHKYGNDINKCFQAMEFEVNVPISIRIMGVIQ
jgi:spore germination protein KC